MSTTEAEPSENVSNIPGVKDLSSAVIDGYYTPLKGLSKHLEELEYANNKALYFNLLVRP